MAIRSHQRTSRLRRSVPWLAAIPALGLAGLVVWALMPPPDFSDAPRPAFNTPPPPVRAPVTPPERAVVIDASAPLQERVLALKALVVSSDSAAPVLEAVRAVRADDPQAAQLRGLCIAAMARFPSDPEARAHLESCVEPSAPRSDRLLAISVFSAFPEARKTLEALRADPDATVRDKAAATLERLQGTSGAGLR